MPRNSVLLIVLALAGCDSATVGNRTQRSGEVKVAIDDPLSANAVETPEGVGAPMAWQVVNGAAFYGAADQPPAFALRCDRTNNAVMVERAGSGSGSALSLSVGGTQTDLAGGRVGDGVQARIGLGDAVLDAMSRSQSQIIVGGGAEPVTVPGGIAIRRIVDACRNPPVVVEPAVEEPAPADTDIPPVLPTPKISS